MKIVIFIVEKEMKRIKTIFYIIFGYNKKIFNRFLVHLFVV
jgi:hypothetical protein